MAAWRSSSSAKLFMECVGSGGSIQGVAGGPLTGRFQPSGSNRPNASRRLDLNPLRTNRPRTHGKAKCFIISAASVLHLKPRIGTHNCKPQWGPSPTKYI